MPKKETQNPEEEPESKDAVMTTSIQNKDVEKEQKERKVIESFITTDDNSSSKNVHISQRLASCFKHDRHSNGLDIIAELSTFRKDMLQLHVKKHQGASKFSFKFMKSGKSRRD